MIPSLRSFRQGPDDQLDYTIDWTQFLAGDTLDSALWQVPDVEGAPVSVQEAINPDQPQTVIWLKGGTSGQRYLITCTITTASTPPRIATRAFRLIVT